MSRASGTDRASRSSFGTTRVSAFTEGGERLIQAGPRPIAAGQSVVEVDPVFGDAELPQPLPLRGEVLRVGRATTVADESGGHRSTVTDSHPPLRLFAYQEGRSRLSWHVVIAIGGPVVDVR